MRKIFILTFLSLFTFQIIQAQLIDPRYVPESVKKKFETKFPDVHFVTWSQTDPGFINATFTVDKHKTMALFATHGEWISTETKLKESEFPMQAINWINTNYPDKKFISLDKSETTKGAEYECELNSKSGKYRLTFDPEGNLLTQNKSSEK